LIYLHSFDNGKHLTNEVKKWFDWYNEERPHQALDYQTPDEVYQQSLKATKNA
jgi:putative transposase